MALGRKKKPVVGYGEMNPDEAVPPALRIAGSYAWKWLARA